MGMGDGRWDCRNVVMSFMTLVVGPEAPRSVDFLTDFPQPRWSSAWTAMPRSASRLK